MPLNEGKTEKFLLFSGMICSLERKFWKESKILDSSFPVKYSLEQYLRLLKTKGGMSYARRVREQAKPQFSFSLFSVC